MNTPAGSIVLATRNRAALLEQCLMSLVEASSSPPFEVVVVDNGSTDSTPDLIRNAERRWPQVRGIVEPRRGSAYALHSGALVARAPILIFMDDDMSAVPDFVKIHLDAHRQHPGSCILGHILSAPGPHPFDRMLAYIFDGSRKSLATREPNFTDYWSGNVSLARETYLRLGGYSEVYARIGYGKDWDFGRRLLADGVPFRFVAEALTYHHFTERFVDRLEKNHSFGIACAYIHHHDPQFPMDPKLLARAPSYAGLLVWLCRVAARALEPFDRGTGVPIVPLAFTYDLGLRMARSRGVSAFGRRVRAGHDTP